MAGGRDQLGPLERVTRILLALEAAEPVGVALGRLLEVAQFGGSEVHQARQLKRDIDGLNAEGWDIRNVAGSGEAAVYRVFARDNRLRVHLSPQHLAELARAAQIAGAEGFRANLGIDATNAGDDAGRSAELSSQYPRGATTTDDTLDKAVHATAQHCLLSFTYKQRPRTVHPHGVYAGASGWYLVGNEDGDDTVKQFVTDRMSEVTVGVPGSATARARVQRKQLNPLTWEVDEPTDIVVATTPDHEPEVERMLGVATHREIDDDEVRLTITITHRAAFRARLYELGLRAVVVAPDEVRDEVIAELEQLAGGPR